MEHEELKRLSVEPYSHRFRGLTDPDPDDISRQLNNLLGSRRQLEAENRRLRAALRSLLADDK